MHIPNQNKWYEEQAKFYSFLRLAAFFEPATKPVWKIPKMHLLETFWLMEQKLPFSVNNLWSVVL